MEQGMKSVEGLMQAFRADPKGIAGGPGALLQVLENKNNLSKQQGGFGAALAAERSRMEAARESQGGAGKPSRPDTGDAAAADRSRRDGEPAAARCCSGDDEDGRKLPVDEDAGVGAKSAKEQAPASQAPADSAEGAESADSVESVDSGDGDTPAAAQSTGGEQASLAGDEAPAAASIAVDGLELTAEDSEATAGAEGQGADSDRTEEQQLAADAEVAAGVEAATAGDVTDGEAVAAGWAAATSGAERSRLRIESAAARAPAAAGKGLDTALTAGVRAQGSAAVAADGAAQAATVQQVIAAQDAAALPRREFVAADNLPAAARDGAAAPETEMSERRQPAVNQERLQEAMRLAARMDPGQSRQAVQERVAGNLQQAVTNVSQLTNAAGASQAATARAATAAQQAAEAGLQQARVSLNQAGWEQVVAKRVVMAAQNGMQSAEIDLDPADLGPIRVTIQINHDQQQASVQFASHSASVRDALEQTAFRLREMFSEQGLDLGDVDVSDHGAASDGQASADQGEPGHGPAATSARTADGMQAEDVAVPVAAGTAGHRLIDYYA